MKSDSQSLNTSLLEVMISNNNHRVVVRDLSDLTSEFIFESCRASTKVGSKHSVAWINSRHAPSWRFYLHCRIEETSSPGIIYIICHQVFRHPSDHMTSSMGKHLLAKAHIAKLNELTELEVAELTSSMVDGTAWSILKRPTSRGTTIASSQKNYLFDM